MTAPAPDINARFVSRRGFLRLCALASGLGPLGTSVALAQTPAPQSLAPKKGGTLRVGFYLEASTMDPHLSGSKVDRQIYHNIYEPLLVLDTAADGGAAGLYERLGFQLAGVIPDYAFKPHGGLSGTMIYWKRTRAAAPG